MNSFENNILAIYGYNGRIWLNQLPILVAKFANQWELSSLTPLDNLSHNYVLSGFKNNQPIILKLGLDYNALSREAMALEHFAQGAVKVLAKDAGALLMQQAVPGTSLKEFSTTDSCFKIRICCELTAKIHHTQLKLKYAFPKISDWLKILDQEWELPKQYLALARKLRDKLLTSIKPQILLHGDLHHDNILKHEGKWLIIDPKGVIGYPINEVWAYVMDIKADTSFIAKFFNYDLNTVRSWYFVHLILASCWCLEDNLAPNKFLDLATKTYNLFHFNLVSPE